MERYGCTKKDKLKQEINKKVKSESANKMINKLFK